MSMPGEQKIEVNLSLSHLLNFVHWCALALGAILVVGGMNSNNGVGAMIAGCFLGIVSRVVQAERHHQMALGMGNRQAST